MRDRLLTMDFGLDYNDVEILYEAYFRLEIRQEFNDWFKKLRCVKEKEKYFWYDGLKLVAITFSN